MKKGDLGDTVLPVILYSWAEPVKVKVERHFLKVKVEEGHFQKKVERGKQRKVVILRQVQPDQIMLLCEKSKYTMFIF